MRSRHLVWDLAIGGIATLLATIHMSGFAQSQCTTPPSARAAGQGSVSAPPGVTSDEPGAGKRVVVTAPEYDGTDVFHTLFLPVNWVPDGKYPVIVEYAPNQTSQFDGTVQDTQLGFFQSGGRDFIWVTMPFINYRTDPPSVATTWWGNGRVNDPVGEQLTAEYTKTNLIRILEEYGGDPASVFLTGFSRGAIGAGYIGLRDDKMADIWLGMLPHSHHDGGSFTPDGGMERLGRLAGRASFVTYGQQGIDGGADNSRRGVAILENLGFPVTSYELPRVGHTDEWIQDDASESSRAVRQAMRDWLADTIARRPGTHSIHGQVADAAGKPLAGVRIQSGETHWTFSNTDGSYELGGLIDSARILTASHPELDFQQASRSVTLAGADLREQNFLATTQIPEPGCHCLLAGMLAVLIMKRHCGICICPRH